MDCATCGAGRGFYEATRYFAADGSGPGRWAWGSGFGGPRVPTDHGDINQHNVVSDADACGDFGVVWDINLTAVITTYFDKEGRRIRQIAEITEDNTVMNTVSGLTLETRHC